MHGSVTLNGQQSHQRQLLGRGFLRIWCHVIFCPSVLLSDEGSDWPADHTGLCQQRQRISARTPDGSFHAHHAQQRAAAALPGLIPSHLFRQVTHWSSCFFTIDHL